jgi:hypothetical protein
MASRGFFLVVKEWEQAPKGAVKCPAELTGRKVQCVQCCLCLPGYGDLNIVVKEH